MRMTFSAGATILLLSAVPSASFAQIVVPHAPSPGAVAGAAVTVALPVGASNCVVGQPNVPLGFLVHLTSDGEIPPSHDTAVRLRRALELQRAYAQR